ncbi:antibiotic biosynthesis monooxygenase [Amylibacter sp. SFDW26]|uniref:putative quinol monooxygenase n=1 Tax=Amylibacter sp. SFDW26 TaxID=2652722 RepID=UPI001261E696|nr:antibiotic biosynthesis monooxygenase [Amylibacter sp. SFDW26]KAB7615581.1 antibiotic biosynthesis monooxygenase [Amylibacter sp. SFDW26]
MTDKKIHLNGYMDAPPDKFEEVNIAVQEHIALTRAEEGCISFEVTPCPNVKGRFLVAEIFQNRAAFDQHQIRTGQSEWAKITKGMPRTYEITEEA